MFACVVQGCGRRDPPRLCASVPLLNLINSNYPTLHSTGTCYHSALLPQAIRKETFTTPDLTLFFLHTNSCPSAVAHSARQTSLSLRKTERQRKSFLLPHFPSFSLMTKTRCSPSESLGFLLPKKRKVKWILQPLV